MQGRLKRFYGVKELKVPIEKDSHFYWLRGFCWWFMSCRLPLNIATAFIPNHVQRKINQRRVEAASLARAGEVKESIKRYNILNAYLHKDVAFLLSYADLSANTGDCQKAINLY